MDAASRGNIDDAHGHGDEGCIDGDRGNEGSAVADRVFVYTGQARSEVPRNVTRIRIEPSVGRIDARSFADCEHLEEVDFSEGLVRIGNYSFSNCVSLERANFPPSVRVIGNSAFAGCHRLAEVDLGESLGRIGQQVFQHCKSLMRVKIPSTITSIGPEAFSDCERLVGLEMNDGLKTISGGAFARCKSLKSVNVPSSVRKIGQRAFSDCKHLAEVELGEGVEDIESTAFIRCISLKCIRIPSSLKVISNSLFYGCDQLIGVALCEGLERICWGAFHRCPSLRNLAIPPTTQGSQSCFSGNCGCQDLLNLFGGGCAVVEALTGRFDALPIHKLCYYQSHHPPDDVLEQLRTLHYKISSASGCCSDCFGMTPLHILACSKQHTLDLYRFVVSNYPQSLIMEDKWGAPPVLYTIWCDAPQKITQFLIDSIKSAHPNHGFNWDKMAETLCRAGASLDVVKTLLETQRVSFPDNNVDCQKLSRELAINCIVKWGILNGPEAQDEDFFSIWREMMDAISRLRGNGALFQCMLETQQRFFPPQDEINWKMVCEELVQPLKGWWRHPVRVKTSTPVMMSMRTFRFLLKCNIPERLNALRVRKWRMDIQKLIDRTHDGAICSRMLSYEREYQQLKDFTSLLELALWKSKIDQSGRERSNEGGEIEHDAAVTREQCRISCRAVIIIPNVLPFLSNAFSPVRLEAWPRLAKRSRAHN